MFIFASHLEASFPDFFVKDFFFRKKMKALRLLLLLFSRVKLRLVPTYYADIRLERRKTLYSVKA